MESGREQNYWPGFVDALSNVVLTLLFVIVVFVFALAIGMSETARKMAELEQQAERFKQQSPSQQLIDQNAELRQELEKNQAALARMHDTNQAQTKEEKKEVEITVAQPPPEENTASKTIGLQVSGDKIIISYPLSAANLDDKSKAALEQALDDFKKRLGGRPVVVRSIEGNEPFSAAQRYAYYRAVNIRNLLIDKKIGDPAKISSQILQPSTTQGGGRVEITF